MASKLKGLLDKIAKENNFEVHCVMVDEKNVLGKYQFMIQITTNPIGICQGSGDTEEEAKNEGLINTLEFIKMMTY